MQELAVTFAPKPFHDNSWSNFKHSCIPLLKTYPGHGSEVHQVAAAKAVAKPIYPEVRTPSIIYPGATTKAPTSCTVLVIFSSLESSPVHYTRTISKSLLLPAYFSTSALSSENCNLKPTFKNSKTSPFPAYPGKPSPSLNMVIWPQTTEIKPGLIAVPS